MALPPPNPGPNPSLPGPCSVQNAIVALNPAYLNVELSWGSTYPLMVQYWYPSSIPPGYLTAGGIVPVLILHGLIEQSYSINSYQGLNYMGQLLASNGFFVVSVQQPLNPGNHGFTSDRLNRIQGVLNWIVQLNTNQGLDPTFLQLGAYLKGQLLCNSMAGIGHSAGGATLTLGMLQKPQFQNQPYQFGAISCLSPDIFPSNEFQTPQVLEALAPPPGIPYQIVHGSADCLFFGAYGGWVSYEDLLASSTSVMRSWVMIDEANHNFFNTLWQVDECSYSLFYCVNPLLPASDMTARIAGQAAAAATYVHAFLQATVNNNFWGYVPFLNGTQANPLPQQAAYQNSPSVNVRVDYRAPGNAIVALVDNFETPWDPSVSPEMPNNIGGLVLAGGSAQLSRVTLQSNQNVLVPVSTTCLLAARITWSTPDDVVTETFGQSVVSFSQRSVVPPYLSFRVGAIEGSTVNPPGQNLDFNVVLVDSNENASNPLPVSAYQAIGPSWQGITYPGTAKIEPTPAPDIVMRHSFMEAVLIPINDFTGTDFNNTSIKMIRFQFNVPSCPAGDIAIDEIHFARGPLAT
ncbi:MAG TPA: hypothetical protein VJM53_07380 [Burkholderiales bacterium]|nr:hypothetical protein [Burkholderiales bacterium]